MPRKNDEKQCIEFCDDIGEIKGVLNYSKINSTFWGAFFERYVGLNFEELGFDVEYRGIKKTYFDGGVDLICRKHNEPIMLVQCKYGTGSIGKQKVEQILFKLGNTIAKEFESEKNISCVLAIGDKIKMSDVNKRRFLRYNSLQSRVLFKLEKFCY